MGKYLTENLREARQVFGVPEHGPRVDAYQPNQSRLAAALAAPEPVFYRVSFKLIGEIPRRPGSLFVVADDSSEAANLALERIGQPAEIFDVRAFSGSELRYLLKQAGKALESVLLPADLRRAGIRSLRNACIT